MILRKSGMTSKRSKKEEAEGEKEGQRKMSNGEHETVNAKCEPTT